MIERSRVNSTPKVAVIGGGILGTLVALNLARLGLNCSIFDARSSLWNGATFAGEGKIHLGYVYGRADDETLVSLLNAATRFADDLEFALQKNLPWETLTSSPFQYGIPPSSLITPAEFETHSQRLSNLISSECGDSRIRYLGTDTCLQRFNAVRDSPRNLFLTPERSLDIKALQLMVAQEIAKRSEIKMYTECKVVQVHRSSGKWELTTQSSIDENNETADFDFVVNCAWENAAFLDNQAGLSQAAPPNLRLRMFLHASTQSPPRALTLTLGPFGDYVSFPDGRAYASWYPSGLIGFCESIQPPPEWALAQDKQLHDIYVRSVMCELLDWVPEVASLSDISVHSRIVVASGSTDIDDPKSQLHQRAAHSIATQNDWISVRSYKLTTAPAAARRVYDHMKELF